MKKYQSLEKLCKAYLSILKFADARRAVAIIITNGPEIVGVSREVGSDQWGTPGGKVEPGETTLQAVIRETKEETGLDIDPKDVTSFYKTSQGPFLVEFFLYKGKPPTKFKESDEGNVKWIPWEKLFKGPFGVSSRLIFLELANGRH